MTKPDQKAVIEIGGKQYFVSQGDELLIEKVNPKIIKNGKLVLNSTLAIIEGNDISFGAPFMKNSVTADVLDPEVKGKKITVIKYKPKIRYKRKQGHRQKYTKIKIGAIAESV